jgi:hypothetical protein
MAEPRAPEDNTTNRNGKDKQGKWSPELLAAAATVIVAALAEYQSSYVFLPTGADVGIAAAVTVLVAACLSGMLYKLRAISQFFITLVVTIALVLGIGIAGYLKDTYPGREAQHQAAAWTAIKMPSLPRGRRISAGATHYGTGYGVDRGQSISIHIDSSRSNLISWLPSKSTTSTYYAQVEARQTSGSAATACTLVFAYRGINSFFQLALRTDGLQLAYWDGKMPARAYEGPVSLPYATNLDAWHTIGVLVEDSQMSAFVDDRKVFSDFISKPLSGRVTFGTLDIGSGYTDDANCEFRNATIRTDIAKN